MIHMVAHMDVEQPLYFPYTIKDIKQIFKHSEERFKKLSNDLDEIILEQFSSIFLKYPKSVQKIISAFAKML